MIDDTIKELSELSTGIWHYVDSINIDIEPGYEPGEVEEIFRNFKNKYFGKDELGEKLFHKFCNEFKEKLYYLPDLNSRTAFVIETIYWLELSIFDEKIIIDIVESNTPENNYNNNSIYELICLADDLQHRVVWKIIDYCELFYIDFDKAYNKAWEITNNVDEDTQPGTPNPPPPPKQTTFKSLFFNDYATNEKIKELKNILETNGYTIKEQWRGITGNRNELAYLYHYLKSNPGVILTGDFKHQIQVFYKEFGLTVKDKLEPGVYCVTKNLENYSEKTDTYKDFESLFSHWVK